MALTRAAFDRLLPPGRAWKPIGDLILLYDAICLSLERVKAFFDGVVNESIPGRSELLIEDWHNALGISYDPTQSLEDRQGRVDAAYTASGGCWKNYLEAQVQREFPGVYLGEIDLYNYSVLGEVVTVSDYFRLLGFVDRIFPLHLVPNYDLTIVETLDVATTGVSICGLALTGKALEV